MKRKNSGLTLIEILTVVGIIAVLAGLLIPTMRMVRKLAMETKQKAELNAIELAILTFKNDHGDYPPSNRAETTCEISANDYSGAQKLAEALCGWDLLGFNRRSCYRSDGTEPNTANLYSQGFANPPSQINLDTLRAQNRQGPYLDMTSINVFRINQLFGTFSPLAGDTYVLCDVFGVRSWQSGGRNIKAGTPILYYRANTASKDHMTSAQYTDRIYNVEDNRHLVDLQPLTPGGKLSAETHPISVNTNSYEYFYYNFIRDPRAPISWPYNPESYILISAGADGQYGTRDDICNFPTPP